MTVKLLLLLLLSSFFLCTAKLGLRVGAVLLKLRKLGRTHLNLELALLLTCCIVAVVVVQLVSDILLMLERVWGS